MGARSQILARARRKLNALAIRAKHRLGLPTLPSAGAVELAPQFRHPIDARRREEYVAAYRARFPEAAQAEIAEADRLRAHQFTFLGFESRHGTRIDWSRDPVNGRDWPRSFSPGISYRGADRLGDIKLPWELAKQQYFFTLGKAYWLTGDARYAAEIAAQIEQFIAANPVHTGIHWTSALEGGTRAASWILAWPFFADSLDAPARDRVLRSLATHLLFVERTLSTGRFANTHLAGEAAILVLGGLFLRSRHSTRWLATGLTHLEGQIDHQLRADGAHAEQSIAYHRFFLDQYYLAQAFLEANGRTLSGHALQRMRAATTYLRDFRTPADGVLNFGDSDDARSLWFHAAAPRDYRGLLALGALRFARGDLKWVAGAATEDLLWLGGPDALSRYAALPASAPAERGAAYPDAGYYLARSGWDSQASIAVFDCGPLGNGPCGHGHADALSLQLHAAGFTFLADPGTWAYNIDYAWRDRFRLTAAHNTVVVDDAEQSIPVDRMSWARTANSRCRRYAAAAGFMLVDGEHDGYARLTPPVTHRRVFAQLDDHAWFVLDCLDGAGAHVIDTRWHLRTECHAEVQDGTAILTSPGGAVLRVHGPAMEITEGWHSDGYGLRATTQVLRTRQKFTDRHRRTWSFALDRAPATAELRGAYARFEAAATLIYRLDPAGRHEEPGLTFGGELMVMRPVAPGAPASLHAENLVHLGLDGIRVSAPQPIVRLTIADGELRIESDGEVSVDAPALRVYVNDARR